MPEIITIGETMVAFTPKSPGFLRYIKDFEMRIAGAESNLAIGAAKLGHSAGWISALGKDEFGQYVCNCIRSEGVDTQSVFFDPNYRTGIMFKQMQNASETSVFYYRENSAASHMDAAILDESYLANSRILHLTGITPVLSTQCRETVEAAMDMAAEHQVDISFDPNIRRKLWGTTDYAPMLKKMMLKSQIVLLGADEAEALIGTRDPKKIGHTMFEQGRAKVVAVKDGANGAVIVTEDAALFIPPCACHPIDPIGAGDAFNAAFLCGILEGKTWKTCGEMGAVAGALATETYGDTEGYPSKERLNSVMQGRNEIYR